MPQYQMTRARDTAPFYFDQLLRIRDLNEAHTQRTRALQDFVNRQRQPQPQFGTPGGLPGYAAAAPNVSGNAELGRRMAAQMGWTGDQWNALYNIGMRESGWNSNAQNPTSSAYGIGQFLDSTWGTVGGRKTSDPNLQIQYMLRYIAQRYGNPINAWSFWNRNHWY